MKSWLAIYFAVACVVAQAQSFPSKPVRVISVAVAGSTADVVARLLGDRMGRALGQPWVVEPRPGASGIVGTEVAARAPADGHTVLLATSTTMALPALSPKLPFDVVKDLVPVIWLSSSPNVMLINADRGVKNLAELINAARKAPEGLLYGTPLVGSAAHLLTETFRRKANTQMTHVPFKGAQQAMIEVLANRVPVTMAGVSNALAHVQAGRLVPLAVADTKRVAAFPNVPTFRELGYEDVDFTFWIGVWATGGTPRAVIERLNTELNAALKAPEVAEHLTKLGFEVVGGTPQRFEELIRRELPLYANIIGQLGIKLE